VRGTRLADLALNLIEIIDRNLYERSCDVRWWATDSALVAACADQTPAALAFASTRLGIILDSYTVYLDLVVCDLDGRVLAHGRPERFAELRATSMVSQAWFRDGLATADGTMFAVADVYRAGELGGSTVATYATAIRAGGESQGVRSESSASCSTGARRRRPCSTVSASRRRRRRAPSWWTPSIACSPPPTVAAC
jgi:hypothetical protein